jgi:predicted porin
MKITKFGAYVVAGAAPRLFAAALCLSAISAAQASDAATSIFKVSGYGTLGIVHSSESQADYTDSPSVSPNGAGHSRNWSADVDTRLGLQVSAGISPKLSAVLQVITQQRYDNSYSPTVEWANINYALTPEFNIRLGRIAMPTFLVGAYRNVGYAMPWARPPVALYGQMLPVTQSDGIDASYRHSFGDVSNVVQLSYGQSDINTPGAQESSHARNIMGIFNTVEDGPTTWRASYQQADLTVPGINALFSNFKNFGPAGSALADQYSFERRRISMLAFGVNYDPGNWFLMAEWGKGKFGSFPGAQTAWYVSSGYRLGALTPYLTYSQSKKQGPTSVAGLDLATLPPAFVAPAAQLNGVLNSLLKPNTGRTLSIGSRWDFRKDAALKVQLDHIKLDENSSGALLNIQPGFRPGGSLHVISATVDFVF